MTWPALATVVTFAVAMAACGMHEMSSSGSTPPGHGVASGSTIAARVAGTVGYRERMALPPGASIEVWVTDTSPGIVTMAILAQVTVEANGRQVPIPFELPIDPARVEPTHSYGLRATIRAGGETLFETREPVPVLTQGHPATVVLLLRRAGAGR